MMQFHMLPCHCSLAICITGDLWFVMVLLPHGNLATSLFEIIQYCHKALLPFIYLAFQMHTLDAVLPSLISAVLPTVWFRAANSTIGRTANCTVVSATIVGHNVFSLYCAFKSFFYLENNKTFVLRWVVYMLSWFFKIHESVSCTNVPIFWHQSVDFGMIVLMAQIVDCCTKSTDLKINMLLLNANIKTSNVIDANFWHNYLLVLSFNIFGAIVHICA